MKHRIPLTDEEIRLRLINILKEIDSFCCAHNLRYSLGYGTLLGAIRHKGFIPWDDDVDLIMPREDYDKFIQLYQDNDKFKALFMSKNEKYYYPFLKVVDNQTDVIEKKRKLDEEMGIYVDIFPFDRIKPELTPSDIHKIIYSTNLNAFTAWGFKRFDFASPFEMVGKVFAFPFFTRKRIAKRAIKLKSELCDNNSSKCANIIWTSKKQIPILDISDFDNLIEVEFENLHFKAIHNYDEFLKECYGNYMELPKKKMQKGHDYIAYLKENI